MPTPEPTYDCFNDPPEVEPNGDISGPGVIAGFMGTAYLALLVLAGYYLFAFDPKKDPYQKRIQSSQKPSVDDGDTGEQIEPNTLSSRQSIHQQHQRRPTDSPTSDLSDLEADWSPNPIDVWFLYTVVQKRLRIRRYSQGNVEGEAKIEKAFNECMRSICDTQLMTGAGILVSAYCILDGADGQGLITAYHWQIAVYLAWLSNLTHTTGLTFLRKYLAHRRTERLWRTASMSCLCLLVLVSFVPLIFFNWDAEGSESEAQPAKPSSLAVCFFRLGVARKRMRDAGFGTPMPYSSGSSAITSILLLSFSFISRMIKLSRTSSQWVRLKIRKRASDATKRFIKWRSPKSTNAGEEGRPMLAARDNLIASLVMALLLTGRLYFDLLTSMLSEVYWAFVAGAWVSVRVFKSRASAHVDEDMFSFGQILAVLLLLSPVVTTIVALWPLQAAFREIQDSRAPRPGELQHAETLPGDSAAEVYYQFSESTTSYKRPGTTLIISGACVLILWTTALFFWNVGSYNASGIDMVLKVLILALTQPCCCFSAYLGTIRAAAEVPPSSQDTRGPDPEATGPTEQPVTRTDQTTEQRPTRLKAREDMVILLTQKQLQNTIILQFVFFPLIATLAVLIGRFMLYSAIGLVPLTSLYNVLLFWNTGLPIKLAMRWLEFLVELYLS